ncbi:hypothetical protein BDW75DRAFT_251655 [Aspergillus navahoensis]
MSHNVFCPICGVILARDLYSPPGPESIPRRRRPWYAEIRGIVSSSTPAADIALTGVGTLHSRGVLIAPADSKRSYVQAEGLYPVSIFSKTGIGWGVHNSCWEILRLRLRPVPETDIVRAVIDVLYNTPCRDGSVFDFGHGYDGAERTHKGQDQVGVDNGLSLYADPCTIPSLDELEDSVPAEPVSHSRLGNYEPRVFGSLSTELKHEILAYLSYSDVCVLRIVCRELADFTHPSNLPQSYWRSRFLLGQEADFLFPTLSERRKWSCLYFGTMALLNPKCPSMVNRKRVRGLVEHIAALVELDAVRPPLHGLPVWPERSSDDCFALTSQEPSPSLLRAHGSFSGQLTASGPDKPLQHGCRILHYRSVFIPLTGKPHEQIAVSTVQIGARSFISGVRFVKDTAGLIGYNYSPCETMIHSPDSSKIQTIHVAICSQGLTGIGFTFSNSESTPWIGQSQGPDIALGNLCVAEAGPCYLVAGLDSFKIVSLGLAVTNLKPPPPLSREQSHLWMPAVPNHEGVNLSTLLPPQSALPFAPLISIDFGAPRGLGLASLTRLVFYMGCDMNPMCGVRAVYANRVSRLYGSENGNELSVCIDGPNGERVTKIAILHRVDNAPRADETPWGEIPILCGVRISTNRGRTATLSTMASRLDANVVIHELKKSNPDHDITGFLAVQVPPREAFLGLGIQYQPPFGPVRAPAMIHRDLYDPDAQLQRDNRFSIYINSSSDSNYQTHASLMGVCRISVSRGRHHGSRSSTCVSGLKLDYYDGRSAVLQPSEHVQSLDIWVIPTRLSRSYPFLQQGRIAAMRFETSFSRVVAFKPPMSDPLSVQHLHNRYGGRPGQQLTAISWILNQSCDRIRAVVSEKSLRLASLLLPEQYPPFDEVQKLYFENVLAGCSPDRLVTAEACFRGTAILGLIFTYASGATAVIGDVMVVPDTRQTIQFPPNAEFVGMSVRVRGRHSRALQFELKAMPKLKTNEHPTPDAPTEFKTLCFQRKDLAAADEHGTENRTGDRWSTWCKDTLSAETFTRKRVSDDVYPPPAGTKLAGLYVRCQHLGFLGALYEPLNAVM